MDDTDRAIIRTLQAEGRLTNQALAERVNLSPSPCLRRVRILERAGVIEGYAAHVNEQAYGLPITAFVRIRLTRHDAAAVAAFERRIRAMPEVVECHIMAGPFDYQLRVLTTDLKEYEGFVRGRLQTLGGIASIDTSFAYGRVKRTSVFPEP